MNYDKHYNNLIVRARTRVAPAVYTERHHILPKCLGGKNIPDNIAVLTAPEHYVAHLLLVRMNPGNRKLVFAAAAMATGSDKNWGRSRNKLYGWLRAELSKANEGNTRRKGKFHSLETRAKMSESAKGHHRAKGSVRSLEHRAAMSISMKGNSFGKGRVLSQYQRSKLLEANTGNGYFKGKCHSPEVRARISASLKKRYAQES